MLEEPTRWDDRLLCGLPESLLHWFACDCAQRALMREYREGRSPAHESWEAVELKRLWLMGQASDQELSEAWAAAETAAKEARDPPRHQLKVIRGVRMNSSLAQWEGASRAQLDRVTDKRALSKNAAWAAAWAAKPSAEAAQVAAWEAAMASESVGDTLLPERAWQLHHLQYLREVWQACGERSIFLLYEQTCPLQKGPLPTYTQGPHDTLPQPANDDVIATETRETEQL